MIFDDFLFDGERLSDYGMIVGSISGDTGSVTPASISFTTASSHTYANDRQYFISSKYEDPLQFEFSIIKYNCDDLDDYVVDRYLESKIYRWLVREDGYKKFQPITTNDYEDIYYNAYINATPIFMGDGKKIGYTLTVTTDSAFAYTPVVSYDYDIDAGKTVELMAVSDKAGYIYPTITLMPKEEISKSLMNAWNINIMEDTMQTNTIIETLASGTEVTINSELGIITGLADPDDWNWVFPRLVQKYEDTTNTLYSSAACRIKIEYTPRRKVTI